MIDVVYFDNAATTFPKPCGVINSIMSANYCAANPGRGGYKLSARAGEEIYAARSKVSRLFSCNEDCVIFTKNCTESAKNNVQCQNSVFLALIADHLHLLKGVFGS